LDVPEPSVLEVKADAQLRAHQSEVAKPASGACGFAKKNSDDCLERKNYFLDKYLDLSAVRIQSDICVISAR
jgi:hypothetical protein